MCIQARLDCGNNVHDGFLRSLESAKTLQAVLHGLASLLLVPVVRLMVEAVPHGRQRVHRVLQCTSQMFHVVSTKFDTVLLLRLRRISDQSDNTSTSLLVDAFLVHAWSNCWFSSSSCLWTWRAFAETILVANARGSCSTLYFGSQSRRVGHVLSESCGADAEWLMNKFFGHD